MNGYFCIFKYNNNYKVSSMRKQLALLAAALLALPMAGKTVDANQAAQTAARFMSGHSALRSTQDLELVYTGQTESQLRAGEAPSFYVYNVKNGTGFVIVAGDDVARPILGYSFQNSFSADVPAHVEAFLGRYDKQIRWAQANGLKSDNADIFPNPNEGKLLETALWSQAEPYNWETPILTNAEGEEEQAVTGCVATAAAIIMQYHQYPTKFQGGEHTWISSKGVTVTLPDGTTVSNERELTVNMDEPTFDWNKILAAYNVDQEDNPQFTEEQGDEVAKLMKYIGAGINMQYDLRSNGGSGAFENDLHKAWINYFQYTGARQMDRAQLTDAAFQRILHEEIDANRPMGYASKSGTHAFVCDGYGPEDYYHFNMGWGGMDNGYYPIDAIIIEDEGGDGASTTTDDYSGGITLHYNLIPSAKEPITDFFTYYTIEEEGDQETLVGIFQTELYDTIEPGKLFDIDLLCVTPINLCGAETAQIAVAHFANDGTIKELVCAPQTHEFKIDMNSYIDFFTEMEKYSEEQWEQLLESSPELALTGQMIASAEDANFEALTCQINQPIEAGDYLMAVSSQDGGKQWFPIVSQIDDDKMDTKMNVDVIELTASTDDDSDLMAPTANASIEAADQANIYGTEGKLCIENAEGEVKVYTATGACIATRQVKGAAQIALPKGVYLVKLGKQTTKVII